MDAPDILAVGDFMRTRILYLGLLLILGCASPHGGFRLPGVPDEVPPNVYGGDGRSSESAFKLRRVSSRDVEYLENGWLYAQYGMMLKPDQSYETFSSNIRRRTETIGKHIFHVVNFQSGNERSPDLYFDVTNIPDS
jgi:hypothetical protein